MIGAAGTLAERQWLYAKPEVENHHEKADVSHVCYGTFVWLGVHSWMREPSAKRRRWRTRYGDDCGLTCDERLLSQLFGLSYDANNSSFTLAPGWYAYAMLPPGHYRDYGARGEDLAEAHSALMKEDPDYEMTFKEIEQWAVEEVLDGRLLDTISAHEALYRKFLAKDIISRIVFRAGPYHITELPPEEIGKPRWGYEGDSFVAGMFSGRENVFHDAVLQFHCCNGSVVVTDLGDPYSQAHRNLMKDPGYRSEFMRLVDPFVEEANALQKPLDIAGVTACNSITLRMRRALQYSPILQRMESSVEKVNKPAHKRRAKEEYHESD